MNSLWKPNINVIIHFTVVPCKDCEELKKLLTDSLNVGKWIHAKYIAKYTYMDKDVYKYTYVYVDMFQN